MFWPWEGPFRNTQFSSSKILVRNSENYNNIALIGVFLVAKTSRSLQSLDVTSYLTRNLFYLRYPIIYNIIALF